MLPSIMFKELLASSVLNTEVASVVIGTAVLLSNTRVMLTATDPFLQ